MVGFVQEASEWIACPRPSLIPEAQHAPSTPSSAECWERALKSPHFCILETKAHPWAWLETWDRINVATWHATNNVRKITSYEITNQRLLWTQTHGFLSMFSLFGFLLTVGSLSILKLDKNRSRYFNIRIKELLVLGITWKNWQRPMVFWTTILIFGKGIN